MNYGQLLLLSLLSLIVGCSNFGLDQIQGVRSESAPLKVRWAKNLDPIYETGNLPIHLGAPVIAGERLFLADGAGNMTAYMAENGRELWSAQDNSVSHSGVLVHDDLVYYGTAQGRFVARKVSDGSELWVIDLGASVETAPTFSSGRLFVQLRNHQIFALDAATGKILWAYKRSVPLLTTLQRAARPAVYNNKLYVGFADGTVASFNVEEGIMLWERKISIGDKFVDVDMTPTFFNDQLWIGSATSDVHVLDPKTGRIIRTVDVMSSHQPLRYGENLVFGSNRGEVVTINPQGKVVLKHKISTNQVSSVSNWKKGFVVTDVEGHVFYVDPVEGKILWQKYLGHSASGIFAGPAVTKERLALLSSRHRLYVFE